MTPRSFIALATATAIMVIAAIAVVSTQTAPVSIPTGRALVFPDVAPNLNAVTTLEIQTAKRKFAIKNADGKWVVADIGNYPVQYEKVKTALIDISRLKFLEAKTADPARYERLEVEDVTTKEASSRRITVRDGKGTVLATGIIGKRNESLFGTDKGGTYLRTGSDAQSWLAEGIVRLGEGPADWVSKAIVDVNGSEIKSMTVSVPSGEQLSVSRTAATDKDFKLEKLPEGKPQRGQWETNQMPKALESLKLEDLNVADRVAFPGGAYVAEFLTFDGLIIRTEAVVLDNKGKKTYWARFSASAAGAAGDNADAVRKRAAEINARVKGFVYKIPEEPGKILTCKLVNMLEGAGINACA